MWTKASPTKEGWKYWRRAKGVYGDYVLIKEIVDYGRMGLCDADSEIRVKDMNGEWWDSDVPEPGAVERLRETIADLKERINDMLDMPKSALKRAKGEIW